jgi:hypothetical protein
MCRLIPTNLVSIDRRKLGHRVRDILMSSLTFLGILSSDVSVSSFCCIDSTYEVIIRVITA